MKTSNKILLVTTVALALSFTSFMLYAKSNMVLNSQERIEGNGVKEQIVLADSTSVYSFKLDDNYEYVLDPTSKQVLISGEANIISQIRYSENDKFYLYREGDTYLKNNLPIVVTIGLAGKPTVDLRISDNAKVTSTSIIEMSMVNLNLDDNARTNLEIESPTINIDADDNSRTTITGNSSYLKVSADDNAKVFAETFTLNSLDVRIRDNGRLNGNVSDIIIGSIKGNGKVYLKSKPSTENINTDDNGRLIIE